ncbi:UbiD family decarboxylase domain-containing protein [Streptomyces angustmyceticus]|uniref:UbiD family decarboxylase domain-containing protein n=1 Tax=Streptomyces angustmyceticus TaxID=285578 RepID=UPI0036F20081
MPFALVQGGEPALPFISGMPLPDGVEEAGYLGALLGEPLELVRCETVDLQVPASAEIVIEGHLSVERTGIEGPMGEFAATAARPPCSPSTPSRPSPTATTPSGRPWSKANPSTSTTRPPASPWPRKS